MVIKVSVPSKTTTFGHYIIACLLTSFIPLLVLNINSNVKYYTAHVVLAAGTINAID